MSPGNFGMLSSILANAGYNLFSVSIIVIPSYLFDALLAIVLNIAIGATVDILVEFTNWLCLATGATF
jgi:hypothetical protein